MNNSLYIQLFSVHGLVRADNLEMGRDADTGGQINYVVELARSLSSMEGVRRVDLFTRLISDPRVSEDYAVPVEEVSDRFRIVRVQCGGKKYIRKELLWPHLDEYIDKVVKFIKRENAVPDVVHGHYADAGYVAMNLAHIFGTPFVFTGHSLGRSKREKLLGDGMREEEIIKKYRISHRINVEEEVLTSADLVITSTEQERDQQYGMYLNRETPRYSIIPPGLDIERFYPYYYDMLADGTRDEIRIQAQATVIGELNRFFTYPDRPLILALCRPDKRKNISGLIHVYGEDRELQAMANLAIFAGIRKDINSMEENERGVLTDMLLLMDKYDLYGKMAIPKKHEFEYQVPELYRLTAERNGVFVNVALTEPFGLTLIEASAAGVPIVATNDGGPRDILRNCKNGVLVDPADNAGISNAIKKIISENDLWTRYSQNGVVNVRKYYTWEAHVKKYHRELSALMKSWKQSDFSASLKTDAIGKRLAGLSYCIITDIDHTLIGDENEHLAELMRIISDNRDCLGFGVATGRTVESAVEHLEAHGVPAPDLVIASVGTEIYYGSSLIYDRGWDTHISNKWDRERVMGVLADVPFLELQEDEKQRNFKISYYMEPGKDRLAEVHNRLVRNRCRYTMIYSADSYLDILPFRASKGKAIRYFSYKWEVPLDHIMVCGDSGNDEEMLRGEPMGVVVGNYQRELEKLRGLRRIFFADGRNAAGIIEALAHYNIIEKARGNTGKHGKRP